MDLAIPPLTFPRKMLDQASKLKSLLRKRTALEVKSEASIVDGSRGRYETISQTGDPNDEPRPPSDVAIGLMPPPAKRQRETIPRPPEVLFEEERGERSDVGYENISGRKRFCIFNYQDFTNGLFSTRVGSDISMQRLSQSFRGLGFEIETYVNLTHDKTMNLLESMREQCDAGDTKMIALAFMSHGDGTDPENFVTSDGKSVSMNSVRRMFSNGNCKGLHGRPKLFFGFYCRNIRESAVLQHQANGAAVLQHQANGADQDDSEIERVLTIIETEYSQVAEIIMEATSNDNGNPNDEHCSSEMHIEASVRPRSRSFLEPDDLEDMITIYSSKPGPYTDSPFNNQAHARSGGVIVIGKRWMLLSRLPLRLAALKIQMREKSPQELNVKF